MRTKTRAKARKATPDVLGDLPPLPAGTILTRFRLDHRAVPWSAPMIGKGRPVKEPRLIAWQALVRLLCPYRGRPYPGPVEVRVVARFRKGPLPDATNILKAVEDSLEHIVYLNDRQVIRNTCERTLAGYDRATIEVRSAEPTPDPEDPR